MTIIIWSDDGLLYWRLYSSLGIHELVLLHKFTSRLKIILHDLNTTNKTYLIDLKSIG